eukprot:5939926-Pleurochrysis_carterae.AAC.1
MTGELQGRAHVGPLLSKHGSNSLRRTCAQGTVRDLAHLSPLLEHVPARACPTPPCPPCRCRPARSESGARQAPRPIQSSGAEAQRTRTRGPLRGASCRCRC